MALITGSNIGQSFGSFDVFGNISISVPGDGKIGLVGPNGIGKTSLLLILAGISAPATGTIHKARGCRIGYLPQEAAQAFNGQNNTVYDEMLNLFSDLQKEEEQLRQMESAMSTGDSNGDLLEKYGQSLEQFELKGGYVYETRIKKVLQGLGFGQEDWEMSLDHLSGGQKTRTLLARLLLEAPELLVLDEPTNHLDIEAIEWLENTLRSWEGAVIVVSHDRYFLDKVVGNIWEMRRDGIEKYRGNYSAYLKQRAERWERRQKQYAARKERLEKELDFVRRNIAAQRTQMAKGKLSRLSRELDAINRAGAQAVEGKSWSEISGSVGGLSRYSMSIAEATAAIKNLERPDGSHRSFKVKMTKAQRSGELVLRTSDLEIGYPDNLLFECDDIELRRLGCAALIGPNGSGKTTFLKTITGQLQPLSGTVRLGASLELGYFAQAHEQLHPKNRVIDELMRHHEMPVSQARNYLGHYMFRGDDVFQLVETLSGGERGRLALAILALARANFLLLDEPTNHLDIPAQEMLQEVIENFDGTILLVTHDRYLVDHLATEIWQLEDGRLEVFKGDYQEFLAEREKMNERKRSENASSRAAIKERSGSSRSNDYANRKKAQRLIEVENQIGEAEQLLAHITRRLQEAAEADAFDNIRGLSIEYTGVEEKLEALLKEWEELAHEQKMA